MAEMFIPFDQNIITRNSDLKLVQPYRKTKVGQQGLSYIGPSLWNNLPSVFKRNNNLNSFKHDLKNKFFDELKSNDSDIYKY